MERSFALRESALLKLKGGVSILLANRFRAKDRKLEAYATEKLARGFSVDKTVATAIDYSRAPMAGQPRRVLIGAN